MSARDTKPRRASRSRAAAAPRPQARAKRATRKSARAVEHHARNAAANPWMKRAARIGYGVRGLLYALMGFFAMALSLGANATPVDQRGTLAMLPTGPVRFIVLSAVIVGLAAYAMWGFIRAIWDPLGRGSDPAGIVSRLGFVWSALNYLALVVFALMFMAGMTSSGNSNSVRDIVASVLDHRGGRAVIVLSGVIAVVGGLGQFWDAWKAGFRHDLDTRKGTRKQRATVTGLGRFGMVARGVVFTTLAWFVLQAGLHDDAGEARSIGGVFSAIAGAPLGHVQLAIVAVGFIALGAQSLMLGAWVKMPMRRVNRRSSGA